MSENKGRNPLILIASILMAVLVVGVLMWKSGAPASDGQSVGEAAEQETGSAGAGSAGESPDKDSTVTTLMTLTGQITGFQDSLDNVRREMAELQQRDQRQQQRIQQLEGKLGVVSGSKPAPIDVDALAARVLNQLQRSESSDRPPEVLTPPPLPRQLQDLMPIGGQTASADTSAVAASVPDTSYENGRYRRYQSQQISAPTASYHANQTDQVQYVGAIGEPEGVPYATIPAYSTLLGATTYTALVGRVPKRDQVADPMSFKLIVGPENLAANGLMIPGLSGMVFSGKAVGDSTFSCVRGFITGGLFVFTDGEIVTFGGDNRVTSTGLASSGVSTGSLGYLSDAYGNPCLPGEYISNATQNLTLAAGAQGLAAVAGGLADAQTTKTQSGATGTTTSTVTGDSFDFLSGQFGSAAFGEVSRYLAEHQSDQWDAVYVPAGQWTAVHIEQTLLIDRGAGRKLFYGNDRERGHAHLD
ncbi:MAG: TIGR03752 family integrating conjugative element protein [Gammaproteobacteria bacterium]|nr:TIGR03752 family integrating conjugative element protein [Gammaproteobacteria bacterium]MCP5135390.1 TIGR03752 family integrating conjugative element protein [Gammaproteobacteria bacterium]